MSVIFCLELRSQSPERFYCRYGGSGEDVGYSVKQTKDGKYIIAGSSSSYGTHGNTDVILMKLDKFGFPAWEKYFGGTGNEVGKSVIQLPDSGYMIAGFTDSYGAGGFDAFIIRTDKDGVQLWQRTFGGADWDFASDLVQAIDGNIFVVGNTYSFGNGKKDGFILKYDMSGNLLNQKFIGGAEDDELRSIIVTNDFNLATVGNTSSRGEINGDGYFAKLDLNGDTLFTKTFGGPLKDYACDLVQKGVSENFDYVVAGARTHLFQTKTNSYMYRISTTGNFVYDYDNYNSSGDENWESLANSSNLSNATAFIRTIPVPALSQQGNIMQKYPNGFEFLVNSFGGALDEAFYSIENVEHGGYIIIGSTVSYGSVGKDIIFIKMDSTIINYSSIVGNKEIRQEKKLDFFYKENHVVGFNFPDNDLPQTAELYDLKGKQIKKVALEKKEIEINLSDLTDSIYIIRFGYSNGQAIYQKLIN
ncbi:hypothetical protein CNR22_16905 [Sphingobacteriaceae bacterium]|nr:hypothetical protein CNR22_16905 [Sphingobacteriaceae bacterium]